MRFVEKKTFWIVTLLLSMSAGKVAAQSFAVRNNLVYDVTMTPNLGFDLKVDSLTTLGAVVGLNA